MASRWGASLLSEAALRSAITAFAQEDHAYCSAVSLLEHLLGVVTRIIEDDHERRISFYSGGFCYAEDVMRTAGFVTVTERAPKYRDVTDENALPYMDEKFFMLPDAVDLGTVLHLQSVLRSALRELYEPAKEKPRLAARLSRLSYDQLADLMASACLRDSTTLSQAEALLSSVDAVPWDTLPALVVSAIAVCLQGGDGLAWCAACSSFRAAQPDLRVLVINNSSARRRTLRRVVELPGEFAVTFESGARNGGVHRIIESMSPRHAAELTHLYAAPWLEDPDEPLLLHPERVVGAHLTALRVLVLTHPGQGWTGGHCAEFAATSCQLIRSVAPTLHTLDVWACTQLNTDELLSVIPGLGGVACLSLDISRQNTLGGAYGDPEDTRRVKRLIRQVCTALEDPAYIKCHTRGNRRHRQAMAEFHGVDFNSGPDSADEGDSEADV